VPYKYYICDVFTNQRFGGNQLAVLPEADGLTNAQMQQIAREFNFSESTFVFSPESGNTRKVRIFTPNIEVPFAGHPNVGTAFVLASAGAFGKLGAKTDIVFEEIAGTVPVSIVNGDPIWCELKAPETLTFGSPVSVEDFASAVSLAPDDIQTDTHLPCSASVGLPFVIGELTDIAALQRAAANIGGLEKLASQGHPSDVHLYVRSDDEFDLRTRMFAPLDGVPEDPATGSANCALVGMLAHYDDADTGVAEWQIAQGVEMGRPSVLTARSEKKDGEVTGIWIGGDCVMVSEGVLYTE
jgi:trans-2,3-dihydro-3-hydroxyanthranilate isomerase